MQVVCGARGVRLTTLNDKRWPCIVWCECTKNRTLIHSPVKTTHDLYPSVPTVLYSDSVCVARCPCLALMYDFCCRSELLLVVIFDK